MTLVRFILIGCIIYLIIRSLIRIGETEGPPVRKPEKDKKSAGKKISKEIGEYVDYEELDK